MSDFLPPSVTKGRFTIESTGDFREFSLNPNTVTDDKGANYPEAIVPGLSEPIIQYGHGTRRGINFILRLDADVGYRVKRQQQKNAAGSGDDIGLNTRAPDILGVPLTVLDEMRWYQSMLYPQGQARLGEVNAHPPILLFTLGDMYQGLRVVMARCKIVARQFTPKMRPSRADASIQLTRKIDRSVLRDEIYDPGRNRVF